MLIFKFPEIFSLKLDAFQINAVFHLFLSEADDFSMQMILGNLMVNTVVVVAVAYVLKRLYKGIKHFASAGKKAKQRSNTKPRAAHE